MLETTLDLICDLEVLLERATDDSQCYENCEDFYDLINNLDNNKIKELYHEINVRIDNDNIDKYDLNEFNKLEDYYNAQIKNYNDNKEGE